MIKRLYLTVLMMLICITIDAAKTYEVEGIFYQVYNKNSEEVMVVKPNNSTSYSGTVTIPSNIQYQEEEETITASVVAISERAFYGCQLTALTLPSSIRTIEYSAFNSCTIETLTLASWKQLCEDILFGDSFANPLPFASHLYFSTNPDEEVTEWEIPENITKINPYAFYNFKRMTSVMLPNTLTEIGSYAFAGCTGLTGINIPDSVITIGGSAFLNCSKMSSVTFAEDSLLETIGKAAFQNCIALSEISIPASVTSIGSGAFEGCTGMRNQKVTFASKEALCQISFGDKYANPLYYARHLYYKDNAKEITALVLPENVTTISAAAFAGGENIITVTIPEAVKQFGADAFLDCKSLQSVSFASTNHIINMIYDNEYASPLRYAQYVTIIGGSIAKITINQDISDNLFANAVWLNEVIIDSGCTKIGKAAFKGCKYLSKVTIREGLETIDNDAFKGCENLNSIILPPTLKKIGTQAFSSCYRLKSIDIPASVETLSSEVFMHCTGLESVTIASTNITIVPTSSFYNCTALKNVQLPNTIQTIGRAAFGKCSSLTTLPTSISLTTINNNAFTECNGIQTLELPSTVKFISQGAFSKCKGLTQLIINAPVSNNEEDKLNIQSGVFAECENLGTIYTHALIAPTADPNAFGGKTNIQLYNNNGATGYDVAPWSNFGPQIKPITQHSITYQVDGKPHQDGPDTYNTGEYVTPKEEPSREGWDFSGWKEEIPNVMPDEDLVINGYFTKKQVINGIYYHLDPNTAKAKVIYHDSYKTKTTINIPPTVSFEATQYYENSTYNVVAIADTAFVKCQKLEEITIPNSVTSIGRGAFKGCTELYKKVTLPAGVTVLSDSLFYNCKNLPGIEMGAVTKIGASAFNECNDLILSTLPATVEKIGSLAFCNCKNLTEFTIPASVEKFADRVFLGCESLKEVTFDTSCHLDTLPAYTFQNCYNLKKFTLAPTMNLIEEGAFMNCRSLDMAKIPGNIGRIKEKAFIGCSGITQVVIPESVKALGGQAFKGCTKIRYVIMEDITPPSAIKTLFEDNVYSKDTLYVPTGAKEAYCNTEPWSLFKNIIERKEYKVTYMVDGKPFGNPQSYQTGATINLIDEAEVEATNPNRKFSGWKNVPTYQAMPDSNITITGVFKYAIIYKDKDNDKELCKDSLWYGDKVVAPAILDSLGHTYSLNSELELMPAKDTTITVTYLVSETEHVSNGIRYYIYTKGENSHAEVMGLAQNNNEQAIIILPNINYLEGNYPVTVIRNDAFKGCKNLKNITLPEGLQRIGAQAFANCNKLTEISIPESVETIGNELFLRCGSLKSISFVNGSKINVLPALTFSECSALSDVALPTSLKTIANEVFRGCKNLKEIVIPEQVDSIGEYVFLGCDSLKKITIASTTTLPTANVNSFDDKTYENAELYVSSLEVQAHIVSPWDQFTLRLGESVIANPCSDPVITYDIKNNNRKLVVTCATEGATIVTNISVPDAQTTKNKEIPLQKTFTVTAYATKTGMRRSRTVSQTFNFEVGDVDNNGIINTVDATEILKKLVE